MSATTLPRGLSQAEAERRLAAEGPNELSRERRRTLPRIALDVLREPMFQLLVGAGVVYLLLGDLGEALMLLGAALLTVGLAVYQESRTERVLEALRDLTSPRALVIRDGVEQRIAGREVVSGDLLVVAEGDRIAADAVILDCNDLQADESLLTGESVPVRKRAGERDEPLGPPGGDDRPFLYAGTVLVGGRGLAEVRATGHRSEIGKIGLELHRIEAEPTPIARETRRLVRIAATGGLSLSALLLLLYGLQGRGWLQGVLAGITLAMSLLPEEFPLILSVFLVLGAWRIARQHVLTRRGAAIEALGAATMLCTDKTGTLTENRMTVARVSVGGDTQAVGTAEQFLPDRFLPLLETAALASEITPFDPMERAIHALAARRFPQSAIERQDWRLVHEYSLTPGLPVMSHVWQRPDGSHVIAAKGAPEAVAGLCRLDEDARAALRIDVTEMASAGLRVLAVARAEAAGPPWPAEQGGFAFNLLGLVALHDPVREGVPEAVAECRAAGIRILMITGDHPETAVAIATAAGIPAGDVLTGAEIDLLDDLALGRRLRTATVCARVQPIQKLRLVEAFKADGEIVAMTGDGVNDAPSLKAAHIGIAMGQRGTDVAREAASLVLLDDNFASIVGAVHLGRRIFDNLCKAMSYVMAMHVPIAGAALLPILFDWPAMLWPIHIVFLELIIDPACSIVFEAEPAEPDAMRRPPRDPRRPLFGLWMVSRSLLEGLGGLVVVIAAFVWALDRGLSEEAARAVGFTTLVVVNLGLLLANRSTTRSAIASLARPNAALWWGLVLTPAALLAAIYLPGLRGLFHFAPLAPGDLAIAAAAGLGAVLWTDLLKLTPRLIRKYRPAAAPRGRASS